MKFFLKTILTIILSFVTGLFFSFWVTAVLIAALNVAYKSKFFSSFFSGFLGLGLCWGAYAFYLSDGPSLRIHTQISELFTLPPDYLLMAIAVFGGIIGGISSFLGYSIQKLFEQKYSPYYK